jgi:hypothetical protein
MLSALESKKSDIFSSLLLSLMVLRGISQLAASSRTSLKGVAQPTMFIKLSYHQYRAETDNLI